MKKFIFKSVIFLLLLFIFTSVLEDIIDLGLRKSKADNFNEWNEILDSKINADLLISGSSRAWLHYSPQVIDSALRLNSYNLGLDGYSFQMQYYRLKLYLENNKKPSFLIQNIDHLTMNKQADLFNYQQFIPYLNNNTIIQGIALYNGFSRLGGGKFIPLYKYMSNSQIAIEGLLNYFHLGRQKTNGKYKGFKAMDRSWDTTFMHFKKTHPYGYQSNIDKNSKALFEDLLKLCEEKKIQLIFVNCPEYIEAQKFCHNRDSIMNIYRAWSLKYNIPYFDYSNDSICFDKANFYNSQHMNNIGVDKFNNILVKDLKGIILKKDR